MTRRLCVRDANGLVAICWVTTDDHFPAELNTEAGRMTLERLADRYVLYRVSPETPTSQVA